MTDITIPPAALEAGARAIAFELGYTWGAKGVDLDAFREAARAVCRAMIEAWPGMRIDDTYRWLSNAAIILPMEDENAES